MAETLQFELVSPERLLISEPVEMVVVPGAEGNFGALPRHAPLLATLRPGILEVYASRERGPTARLFVAGGYAEVTPERLTVLADEAMPVADLDRVKIEAQIKDLRDDWADAKEAPAKRRIEARIAVAEAKLKAAA
ncbi:MAG TPA: F0F1 ATP synthase subunit epsilon [Alphaproteobacteria bacterium]|nr:F0F1 ATP synthase subunit epsilon [Alphaproteobacteria bacterium]